MPEKSKVPFIVKMYMDEVHGYPPSEENCLHGPSFFNQLSRAIESVGGFDAAGISEDEFTLMREAHVAKYMEMQIRRRRNFVAPTEPKKKGQSGKPSGNSFSLDRS